MSLSHFRRKYSGEVMINYNSLLPKIVRRIIVENAIDNTNLPYFEKVSSGVLFTDVKGFTKMTELVSKGGHYSVEIITDLLNSYFDSMNTCIDAFGGDLIKFGGDSILAIFPGSKHSAEMRMKACLVKMRDNLRILNKGFIKKYQLEIDIHGNMSWGQVNVNIVGNPAHHLDYFLTGDALEELFSKSDTDLDYRNVENIYAEEEEKSLVTKDQASKFFPKRISDWLENSKFLGELKKSSVIFVKLENFSNRSREISLTSYHKFYQELQNIVYFYEGTINKIDYTDKGYLILITFGVPNIHKDDIERAFICSSKISKLAIDGIKTKIGLTYNNIFSGILGAKNRYEYGIIGNGVNISARLMSESAYNDFTFTSEINPFIKGRYDTELIKKVLVKGIADEIEIYRVSNELSNYWSSYELNYSKEIILGYNDIFSEMESNQFIFISGYSGTGKSHLVYDFLKSKVKEKIPVNILVMSEYDKLKPFTIFYRLFSYYHEIDNMKEDINLIKNILEIKQIKLDLDIVIDYFNEKSLEIKEKNLSLVQDILTEILVNVLSTTKYLVIENIQWLDYESDSLLQKLVPKLISEKKVLLLTANDADYKNEYEIFSPLKVQTMNFDEKLTHEFFLSHNLNITSTAIDQILELSHHNPAYIKEICTIIKKHISNSKVIFDASDFKQLVREGKLPNSFETVLLNEFESLDDDTKQLLKYASIIGVSFNDQIFRIFPEEFLEEHIKSVLKKLTQNRHIFKKVIIPDIEYYFNSSMMRDAIYRTILFSEKHKLHVTIANYYIKHYSDKLSLYYEIIANHFLLAESRTESLKWSLLAAKKNMDISAYGVSNHYYTNALRFASDEKQKNQILLNLVKVNLARNKIPKVTELFDKIEIKLLSPKELDFYYLSKIRLFEIQKDFTHFLQTYQEIKDSIKSNEVLMRIKLLLLDYYRMSNSPKNFEALKKDLIVNIDDQAVIIRIIYYSILGQHSLDRAEYVTAKNTYESLYAVAMKHNKKLYLRIATTSLGIIQVRQGNQVEALKYFKESLNIAEDIGDKHGYAKVNTEIAMIYFAQGLDDKALETLENCLFTAKYIGDKQQEQTVLYNFGYIYSILQEYNTAIEYLLQARDIALLINDKVGISYSNDGLGDAYFQQQLFSKAKEIYEENLLLQKELHDKEGIAHTIGNLANILREEKKYPEALENYQIQYNSLHEIGDKIGEGKALFNWGITFEILGDKTKAIAKLKQAHKLFTEANDKNYSDFTLQQIERIENE